MSFVKSTHRMNLSLAKSPPIRNKSISISKRGGGVSITLHLRFLFAHWKVVKFVDNRSMVSLWEFQFQSKMTTWSTSNRWSVQTSDWSSDWNLLASSNEITTLFKVNWNRLVSKCWRSRKIKGQIHLHIKQFHLNGRYMRRHADLVMTHSNEPLSEIETESQHAKSWTNLCQELIKNNWRCAPSFSYEKK